MRTGFPGKLVLQEECQELTSPLLPQHKALSSPEPPAYASSRSTLPELHKASSAHAQAAEKPGLSRGTRVILQQGKPSSLTALPGLSPELLCKGSCPRMVTQVGCSGTRPAGRMRLAHSSQSHCSRVFHLRPHLSALKTRDRQLGQGGAQKILT